MKLRVAHALVALSLAPLLGGGVRLAGLAGGDAAPMDRRFVHSPLPVVMHIVAAGLFSVLGALQFESDLRRAWPRWHRHVGWGLALFGLLTAATGVWMTLRYTISSPLQGSLQFWVRLAVCGAMALGLVLALQSILAGNVAAHRAWMLRAYALGQGAGTQVLFLLPPALLSGQAVSGLPRDVRGPSTSCLQSIRFVREVLATLSGRSLGNCRPGLCIVVVNRLGAGHEPAFPVDGSMSW